MFTINCKGRLLSFTKPVVMGIINTTPDSFYSESRVKNDSSIIERVEKMLADGAAIIDVGGQSTRPGSQRISMEEELKRIVPVIESLIKNFPHAIISIDTFYAKVAQYCIEAGASSINDVSAGTIDEDLLPTVSALKVPYVLMHMQGDPQTMQQNPVYKNVVLDVFDALNFKLHELTQAGIKDVIIDPGFGFGKTAAHNFKLLGELSFFKNLERPVMVGLSRKGTVYKTLGTTAAKALNGSTVVHTIALMNGASILRVHDVKEAVQAITLVEAYKKEKEQL